MAQPGARPTYTQAEVEQNIEQIRLEGIAGQTVLDVRVNPGIEAGPFIHIDVDNDVIVLPFTLRKEE